MCIAILLKPGAVISDGNVRAAANQNRDGGGMAYIRDGKVVIDKGYMNVEELLKRYKEVVAEGLHKDNPMLMHFRIATTGRVSNENCHPFPIGLEEGDGALIHNGSFFSGPQHCEKSDTRVVAERVGKKFLYEPTLFAKERISREVGAYNKVALLYNTGDYIILNEQAGAWDNGIWYSNSWFAGRAYKDDGGYVTSRCNVTPLNRYNPGADV